jgi:hypothetical protein
MVDSIEYRVFGKTNAWPTVLAYSAEFIEYSPIFIPTFLAPLPICPALGLASLLAQCIPWSRLDHHWLSALHHTSTVTTQPVLFSRPVLPAQLSGWPSCQIHQLWPRQRKKLPSSGISPPSTFPLLLSILVPARCSCWLSEFNFSLYPLA